MTLRARSSSAAAHSATMPGLGQNGSIKRSANEHSIRATDKRWEVDHVQMLPARRNHFRSYYGETTLDQTGSR
jgi:hypothetical protein